MKPPSARAWAIQWLPSEPEGVGAEAGGYEIGISQGSFKANSKALAEGAGDGIAKVIFRKDTYEVLAVHIVGLHAADLIQECANAIEVI